MSLQIKRQPLNLEELVKKSFRWHFLPSEFVSLSQNKAVRLYLHWFGNRVLPEDKSWFLSVANPTAAKGRCIVGNLPNRVPDLPEFHSIGLQSDNLPVEKLARSALLDANSSEKLNQLGISCKILLHNRSLGDPCHLLQRCELWVGSSTFPSW